VALSGAGQKHISTQAGDASKRLLVYALLHVDDLEEYELQYFVGGRALWTESPVRNGGTTMSDADGIKAAHSVSAAGGLQARCGLCRWLPSKALDGFVSGLLKAVSC
jgi:hypothetical protein